MIAGCLALNASYEPLTMVPLRRALRLVIDGKAEIVEAERERPVRSERASFARPAATMPLVSMLPSSTKITSYAIPMPSSAG